jgi:hypothetical protein
MNYWFLRDIHHVDDSSAKSSNSLNTPMKRISSVSVFYRWNLWLSTYFWHFSLCFDYSSASTQYKKPIRRAVYLVLPHGNASSCGVPMPHFFRCHTQNPSFDGDVTTMQQALELHPHLCKYYWVKKKLHICIIMYIVWFNVILSDCPVLTPPFACTSKVTLGPSQAL